MLSLLHDLSTGFASIVFSYHRRQSENRKVMFLKARQFFEFLLMQKPVLNVKHFMSFKWARGTKSERGKIYLFNKIYRKKSQVEKSYEIRQSTQSIVVIQLLQLCIHTFIESAKKVQLQNDVINQITTPCEHKRTHTFLSSKSQQKANLDRFFKETNFSCNKK